MVGHISVRIDAAVDNTFASCTSVIHLIDVYGKKRNLRKANGAYQNSHIRIAITGAGTLFSPTTSCLLSGAGPGLVDILRGVVSRGLGVVDGK